MKTGITGGSFQQEGKQDFARQFLKSFVRIGESSGEHFCKTMTGIPSGPVAFEESRSEIIEATAITEKLTWLKIWLVLIGKSGRVAPESSMFEFLEKIWVKSSDLFLEEVSTSGSL